MKPTHRSTLRLAIVQMLTLFILSCGQKTAPQHTLADDIALRIARSTLLSEALTLTKQELLANLDMDVVMQPLDEPLELKAARILVHGYADQATLEASARLFNENFGKHTKKLAQMWDLATPNSRFTARFMDPMLSDAASSKDNRNKDQTASLEKYSLELLNSSADKAALVKQTAGLLPALRSQDTLTTVERLRAALSQAVARHPEQLKPFSDEKPLSPALRAAIDKLQSLLQHPGK